MFWLWDFFKLLRLNKIFHQLFLVRTNSLLCSVLYITNFTSSLFHGTNLFIHLHESFGDWSYMSLLYILMKSRCVSASPPWFQGCSLACLCSFFFFFPFRWSKRYPDCPPTWLSWEQMSHDLKWDKLWMREDWLSGGRQSPSQFIWHGYLGNRAVRQEAGRRCKPLFVWLRAKKLPVLQASRGWAVNLTILNMQENALLFVHSLPICILMHLPTVLHKSVENNISGLFLGSRKFWVIPLRSKTLIIEHLTTRLMG